jgi:hypothetical protein
MRLGGCAGHYPEVYELSSYRARFRFVNKNQCLSTGLKVVRETYGRIRNEVPGS